MSISGFVRGLVRQFRATRARGAALRGADPARVDAACKNWGESLADPTPYYLDCFRCFHLRLPQELRDHRNYFTAKNRGFGEDAFHTMWTMLFQEFGIRDFLEIGVYRGQTLTLAALLQRRSCTAGQIAGVSPFEPVGDSVSRYRGGIDYEADTFANFAHFKLPRPRLLKAYSTDPVALEFIRAGRWDCIYIDGNHDYDVARADWNVCAESVKRGGVIVLDDSGLTTRFEPPAFATGGHPGPSRVAQEIDRAAFTEILQVGHNRVFQRNA